MDVSINLGVPDVGALIRRSLLFVVHSGTPDFCWNFACSRSLILTAVKKWNPKL